MLRYCIHNKKKLPWQNNLTRVETVSILKVFAIRDKGVKNNREDLLASKEKEIN